MKRIFHKSFLVLAILAMGMQSCTKNFEDINTDPNNTPNALPKQLLAPILVNIMGYNQLRNRNFNNELMQVTVDLGDGDGKVFRYDYRSTWSDYLYNGWYASLTNIKDLYKISSNEPNINTSYQAISLILQSWVYSLLTDTYGDVPYFDSNTAKDSANYQPNFDKQKDIYFDIFQKLERANDLLKAGTAIDVSADPVYAGSVSRWRKFGNSLYLRLLLRLSGKQEVSANVIAKMKEILETNTGNYPIIASNDESAILRWTGVAPYTSPLLTVREQDFRAVTLGSFFIDNLVTWQDPRIDIPTYGTNGFNRWRIAPYQGAYLGAPSGYAPGQPAVKKSYFYSTSSALTMQNEPLTGMIMNYAEVQFIKAEAALKGFISGDPMSFYNSGVDAGIKLWLPTYPIAVTDYLAAADMQWLTTLSFDDKMERIHLQKYYALFLVDMQQWFEYRRTGHPHLPMGSGLKNNGVMPARMTYPVYVQSTNPSHYQQAVAQQGPDLISTQVWWQKP